jgi:hypothetical protein
MQDGGNRQVAISRGFVFSEMQLSGKTKGNPDPGSSGFPSAGGLDMILRRRKTD